jgi:hypothetical protein
MSFDFGGFAAGALNAASKARTGEQAGEYAKQEQASRDAQLAFANQMKALGLYVDQRNANAHQQQADAATTNAERPHPWEPQTMEEKVEYDRQAAQARAKAALERIRSSTAELDAARAARVQQKTQEFIRQGMKPAEAHTRASQWVREELAMTNTPDMFQQMMTLLTAYGTQQGTPPAAAPALPVQP